MAAILLENVSKTYSRLGKKPVRALDAINLEIAEGEAFGFVGQNGAGKSTTIKILVNAIRASSGLARLFGIDVSDARSRIGLGFVPENPNLYAYLTPWELVALGARMRGVRGAALAQQTDYWLQRFDVAHVARRQIRGFSKGMVQRVAMAHALVSGPRLLILDEPLSGLDPLGRKTVVDVLEEYRNQGGSVFFSSHVLHDVERLANRFGLIHHGQLQVIRTPAEVLRSGGDRVRVRYQGNTALPDSAAESAGLWRLDVGREDLWTVLDAVKGSGGTLIEIKPAVSLESAFLDFIHNSAPATAAE